MTLAGLMIGLMLAAGAVQASNVSILWDSGSGNRPTITPKPVDWVQALIQEFQKTNPDIDVQHNFDASSAYTVQIAAGSGPDVITDCCSQFHEGGVNGSFIDLTPFLGTVLPNYQATQTFWPPQWGAFQSKGHQFALPQYLGTIAVYANLDLFRNAGVAVPSADLSQNQQGWPQFEALCQKLTKVDASGKITQYGLVKGMSGDRIGYWMLAAGAQFYVDGSPDQSALASPEAVEALTYLQRLQNQDQCINTSDGTFTNGQAAMMEEGVWELNSIIGATAEGKAKVDFSANIFPMPIGPSGKRATLATIDGFGISKSTKHLQESLKFLKFLASQQGNAMRAQMIGLMPARKDVIPQFLNLMDAINHQTFEVNSHVFSDAGAYAYPQYLYVNQQVADGILNAAYTKIFGQDQPVQNTWYPAVKSLNSTLKALSTANVKPHQVISVEFGGDPFKSQDINTITYGTTTVKDGQMSITADGSDIQGNADQFRYAYEPVSGDFTATVELLKAPDTNEWSKAGIMIRADTTSSAADLLLNGTDLHGVRFQYRDAALGGTTDSVDGGAWTNGTPLWLKLVRSGNTLTGYRSADGKTWSKVSSHVLNIKSSVLIGLAVTSHAYAVQGTGTFAHWSLVRSS